MLKEATVELDQSAYKLGPALKSLAGVLRSDEPLVENNEKYNVVKFYEIPGNITDEEIKKLIQDHLGFRIKNILIGK